MLERVLRVLFGRATLDMGRVASALASGTLEDYASMLEMLDPITTVQYFRTQYMRLVVNYGLPADCCNEVADRAWALVAQARRGQPDGVGAGFSFYD